MDERLTKIFTKVGINEKYFFEFSNASLKNIKINEKEKKMLIQIKTDTNISLDAYKNIKEKFKQYFQDTEIIIAIEVEKTNDRIYRSYYNDVIDFMALENPVVLNFKNRLMVGANRYYIDAINESEESQIKNYLKSINEFLNCCGFPNAEIRLNDELRNETLKMIDKDINDAINKEIITPIREVVKEQPRIYERKPKVQKEIKDGCIWGSSINDEFVPIDAINNEVARVTIEAMVIKISEFAPVGRDFKVLTFDVNDGTRTISCKVFTRGEEYDLLKHEVRENMWFRFRGSTKVDRYANNELVLNIRDINLIDEKDIEIDLEKAQKKEMPVEVKATDENTIFGGIITGEVVPIHSIVGEEDNIVIEACVFGIEEFEPANKDFKILTLKVTDNTDSMYCKVFVRGSEEFSKLKKQTKPGTWLKLKGTVKLDKYSQNEEVLNVRDINAIESKDVKIKDNAEEKRVELHAHTQMSQMDGITEAKALVKQAKKWGHKAVAITDHDGCQSFPDVYHTICDLNKELQEGEEPFKAIYGTELTLIEDTVDIVVRPKDEPLLENTFVVFDFETTGFNAGAGDQIIEVGAAKIQNGEILDMFSELIDPKRELSKTITEVTGITNEMLKGKPTEEDVIKRFMEWTGNLPMVAHNAKFDTSFLEMAYHKYNLGKLENTIIDTLALSRILDGGSRHSLSALVKRYEVEFDEDSHHRADYDAKGTAIVFHRMMQKMANKDILKITDLEKLIPKDEIYKFGSSYHVNILVKNKVGLKNLFKIVSFANTKYFYKGSARILRSVLAEHREGLLIGSGCYESEVFNEARSKSDSELLDIINFYDYVEVQPLECYDHLLQMSDFKDKKELTDHVTRLIRLTKDAGKLIVATGDVHHLEKKDKIFREVIVNQKVPGGGRHPLARNSITEIPSMHFRTTDEMLNNFNFLSEDLRKEIVITNPNKIADMVEIIEVIIETGGIPFSPKIENSQETTKELVFGKAHELYGDPLPNIIAERIDQELAGIFKGGFDVIYLIAQKLVKKSNDDGYLVGSRGSVGSSFVATMMGITEVNPLPAHYRCPNCKYSIFEMDGKLLGSEYSSGYDLPDKDCPKCGTLMKKEGQDMPFATFLGFNADKVPDIDLNFSGDYQAHAHAYTKVLFGEDNVYRAGTIGTVADKTAFGFAKGFCEDKGVKMRTAEIERIAIGCTGVKRTTGQHPGGIVVIPGYMDVYDFTPYQYPAGDTTAEWRTTHFDYHAIDQDVLKLDILGHDDPTILRMLQDLSGIDVTTLPMDDKKIISLLSSPEALGVTEEQIDCKTGTLGLPELGTRFVIKMLEETKPQTFSELVKISGLSHGTDVWAGNASVLIEKNIVPFKEVIGCRDDIMVYLKYHGMEPLDAFKIMEFVRKGKASKDPETWKKWEAKMKEANIPEWYIESCHKIKYMFPKAHACAYVMSAIRIAWFKVYRPVLYYASYFSIRSDDFDIETMVKGYDAIKSKLEDLKLKGYDLSNKETSISTVLEIALEATARNIRFTNVDLMKSDAINFKIDEEQMLLIPSFRTIDGLGDTVAKAIVEEREKQEFLSIEDLQKRAKVSSTLIEKMRKMGVLDGLPESSQLTLF